MPGTDLISGMQKNPKTFVLTLACFYALAATNLYLLPALILFPESTSPSSTPAEASEISGQTNTPVSADDLICSCSHCNGPSDGSCECTHCNCGVNGACGIEGAPFDEGTNQTEHQGEARSQISGCGQQAEDLAYSSHLRLPPAVLNSPDQKRSLTSSSIRIEETGFFPAGVRETPEKVPRWA